MSLINEALKRAEKEGRRVRGPGVSHDSIGRMGRPGSVRRKPRPVLILSVFLLAAAAIVTYVSLPPGTLPRPLAAGRADTPEPSDVPRRVEMISIEPPTPAPAPAPPIPQAALSRQIASVRNSLAALNDYTPTPAPAPIVPPPPPIRPAAEPAGPDPGDYQLGAILSSGANSRVLINNQLVGIGDAINGAKVVEVGKYHVTLEMDGKRLTLRM